MTNRHERPSASETADGDGDTPGRLASVRVRYDARPDRCTVYPPGLSGAARMSTWLTADADAFVDLEAVR